MKMADETNDSPEFRAVLKLPRLPRLTTKDVQVAIGGLAVVIPMLIWVWVIAMSKGASIVVFLLIFAVWLPPTLIGIMIAIIVGRIWRRSK